MNYSKIVLLKADGTPVPYNTVAAAIAAATANDVVIVYPGTYAEDVTIPAGISVIELGPVSYNSITVEAGGKRESLNGEKKGTLIAFGGVVAPNLTQYMRPYGAGDSGAVAQKYQAQISVPAGRVEQMRIWIVANVGVTSYTLTVQKGGVSQTITKNCAVNAGTGILYKDDVNTFTTVDDDLIGVEVVTGANGAFTPAYVYVTMVLIPS